MTRYTRYGILGDAGAVSRVARKGGTKVFKYGRESPWVPTLTELFKRMPAPGWAQKNALYYFDQSANILSWVLFVSSYSTAIVPPHLPGSFNKLVPGRETFIFYFPNQKRRNYRRVEKTFGMISAGAIEFAPMIFCFWRQLPDYPWKCLISRFVMDVNKQWQNSFSSWTWIWFIEIQLQKCSLAFDKVSELE